MHNFPNILEEQPGTYDYYISRYSFLLSQIGKVPEVANYLTEKEVTRHCLKSFMSSRHTKSVTKLLQLRGVSSHSFHRFNDMKEELIEAIQRTDKKHQMMLKGQVQSALMPKFSAVKSTKNICKRKPVSAPAPAPAPTPVPTTIPVPEKVAVSKKQGSPLTKSAVPKKVEANNKTEHESESKSPKCKKTNKKKLDYFNDNVVSGITTLLVTEAAKEPLSPYDTGVFTASDKQPLKPDDTIFKAYRDEAKKPSAVPSHLLSLFTDVESNEVRVGSSSGWTPETLYCYTPEYRARALLGCL
ncbi:unnamed protein product [Ambrosiozyma monospora]|uniref:Unnamed protein product n=1 Tax=Ambrosiozyma monospora TaxID=43982 RepID=A0A9W7DFB7_AMBMO|nr:unnamed protein product [Ambrosiozyma monospora]